MTTYVIGNSATDFDSPDLYAPHVRTIINASTTSDTNPGNAATQVYGGKGGMRINFSQAVSEFWMTAWMYSYQTNLEAGIQFRDGDNSVMRIKAISATRFSIDLWDGAAWVIVVPSTPWVITSIDQRIDIRFKMDSTVGEIEFYIGNTLVASFYGNTVRTASTTVDILVLDSWRDIESWRSEWSQLLIQSDTTIGVEVLLLHPNGTTVLAGQDSGALSDINEIGGYTTGDISKMVYSTLDATSAFTTGNLPTQFLTGWVVSSVVANVRATIGENSALNAVAPMIRTATNVNEFGPNFLIDTTFKTSFAEFLVNPDTGVAWTITEAQSTAIGARVTTI